MAAAAAAAAAAARQEITDGKSGLSFGEKMRLGAEIWAAKSIEEKDVRAPAAPRPAVRARAGGGGCEGSAGFRGRGWEAGESFKGGWMGGWMNREMHPWMEGSAGFQKRG